MNDLLKQSGFFFGKLRPVGAFPVFLSCIACFFKTGDRLLDSTRDFIIQSLVSTQIRLNGICLDDRRIGDRRMELRLGS